MFLIFYTHKKTSIIHKDIFKLSFMSFCIYIVAILYVSIDQNYTAICTNKTKKKMAYAVYDIPKVFHCSHFMLFQCIF